MPLALGFAEIPTSRFVACLVLALGLCSLTLVGAGCGNRSTTDAASDFTAPGPFPVGNTTVLLHDAGRDRALTVEVWYPARESARAAAAEGAPVESFLADADERARYVALLADSPDPGPTRRTSSARDAAPAQGDAPWPLLVFSHCHTCTRFSSFSIAQRLASHGFVVAAPDHAGNTLFDDTLGLNSDTLRVRGADVSFVLDALLADRDGAEALPGALRGTFDATRLGVFGHSFGGVTTGLVLQDDARFRAGAAIAAPFENPLLTGVFMDRIAQPILFLVAREDNSIQEIGNQFIRANFAATRAEAWKVEVADAGHWSFSDLCHLGTFFTPGCGEGIRQTIPGEPFTYLPIARGLEIGSSFVTAYFAAELRADPAGRAFLAAGDDPGRVDVESRD